MHSGLNRVGPASVRCLSLRARPAVGQSRWGASARAPYDQVSRRTALASSRLGHQADTTSYRLHDAEDSMGLVEALPSLGSCAAGILFGAAWLVWIDGVAFAAHEGYGVNGVHWLPGILQTLALFMVNVINWSALTEDAFMDEGRGAKVKCWIFTSFVFAFSGLIGAIWILVAESNAPYELETVSLNA